MLSFGVPVEKAREFVERHCVINSLSAEQRQMLMNSLEVLAGSFSLEDEERRVKIRKAAWLREKKEEWVKNHEQRLKRMRSPTAQLVTKSSKIASAPSSLFSRSNESSLDEQGR